MSVFLVFCQSKQSCSSLYLYSNIHLWKVLGKEAKDNTWPLDLYGEDTPFLCKAIHLPDYVKDLEALAKSKTTRLWQLPTVFYKWQPVSIGRSDITLKKADCIVFKRKTAPQEKEIKKNDSLHSLNSSKTGRQSPQRTVSRRREFSRPKYGFRFLRQRTGFLNVNPTIPSTTS